MLQVQKYLISGNDLSSLHYKFGIKYQEDKDLVILNYDQIESPKMHPIVMECRGLVLEKNSWDIVSFPFKRFFNYGEALEITKNFDFEQADVFEKVDGSLIHLSYYKNEWRIFTRGTLGSAVVGNKRDGSLKETRKTFERLFFETLIYSGIIKPYGKVPFDFFEKLNKNYNYIFELCTPENKVITEYKDYRLYLLSIRDKSAHFRELLPATVHLESVYIGTPMPKMFAINEYGKIVEEFGKIKALDEGFVCVIPDPNQQSFERVKVKNPLYVAISTMGQSQNYNKAMMLLVMRNEFAEYLTYFPGKEQEVRLLANKYGNFLGKIFKDTEAVKDLLYGPKKEYAMVASKMTYPTFMFQLYKHNDDKDYGWNKFVNEQSNIENFAEKLFELVNKC